MKHAFIGVAILLTACSTTSRPNPELATAVLRGVHSVYVEPFGRRVLEPIEGSLPQVKLVSSAADADVLITFDAAEPHGTSQTYGSMTREVPTSSGTQTVPGSVSVPSGPPTSAPPHSVVVRAINRANGKSVVIYDGFTEYMGAHIAPQFITAWRAANNS